jgi:hypothetical protein
MILIRNHLFVSFPMNLVLNMLAIHLFRYQRRRFTKGSVKLLKSIE